VAWTGGDSYCRLATNTSGYVLQLVSAGEGTSSVWFRRLIRAMIAHDHLELQTVSSEDGKSVEKWVRQLKPYTLLSAEPADMRPTARGTQS